MEQVTHCRQCGRVMKNKRIDAHRMKMTCSCGFADYRTVLEKLTTVNPFCFDASTIPFMESENGGQTLRTHTANREYLEIVTLKDISLLVSADLDLSQVLQRICKILKQQLQLDVCSIYLVEGEELVLAATEGFDPAFIGLLKIRIGEGVAGAVVRDRKFVTLSHASRDPRYKRFTELKEENYNTMLSFPVMDEWNVYGVINCNSTSMKTINDDEIYFVMIVANMILAAIKSRRKGAAAAPGR